MRAAWDAMQFVEDLRGDPRYREQIAHVRDEPARAPEFADLARPLAAPLAEALALRGIERLYSHQAEAIELARAGRDVVIASGTASGKSLCYTVPVVEALLEEPAATAFLVFPTKALTQDQFGSFERLLADARLTRTLPAGVYDGDTGGSARSRLRARGRVIFTNPDLLHSSMMANPPAWDRLLEGLRWLVFDELHTYGGMFGSGVANLMRRFLRICERYGSSPRILACSATIANPRELAETLFDRPFELVERDGSPRGRRLTVFWNPPIERSGEWRSRRSANVEAHDLVTALVRAGHPTIVFSKAKMTAELIHRYVRERLEREDPSLSERLSAYRGGYLPEERREIERRLFSGELLAVSTTPALELGIDVGGLDACVVVGYPGTVASFRQQAGRAGRREREALAVLVGLDTPVNQYVMSHPEHILDRPVERAVIDRDNPFIVAGHLRCAAREAPIGSEEVGRFGPSAPVALDALTDGGYLRRSGGRWFHASIEAPHHVVRLREFCDRTVVIRDVDTGETIGEMNQYDAQAIVHREAIYLHRGDTYLVLELDFDHNIAQVRRVESDYYTQPIGGTDVHHIDRLVRRRPFGSGFACWGEVTTHFQCVGYERIRFYTLDTVSTHELQMPTFLLETVAFWLEPPASLIREMEALGLRPHNGLRGVGYATRSMLPLFLGCQTLDFSHTVGCQNAPWRTVFVYERFPLGLGFTHAAFALLGRLMPAVREHVRACPCEDGCPSCVGKPLRGFTTWNVERGEAAIPSKASTLAILDGLLGDGTRLEEPEEVPAARGEAEWVESALRRRLARLGQPWEMHPPATAEELEASYQKGD